MSDDSIKLANGLKIPRECALAPKSAQTVRLYTEAEVAAAVQAEREAIVGHLVDEVIRHRTDGDGCKERFCCRYSCSDLDRFVAMIQSRPAPAVDVLGVVRRWRDASAAWDKAHEAKSKSANPETRRAFILADAELDDAEAALRSLVNGAPAKPAVDVLGHAKAARNEIWAADLIVTMERLLHAIEPCRGADFGLETAESERLEAAIRDAKRALVPPQPNVVDGAAAEGGET